MEGEPGPVEHPQPPDMQQGWRGGLSISWKTADQGTPSVLFTVLDPEQGSQSTKDVLLFFFFFFFNGTTFRLLSKVSSGSPS